MLLGIDVGTGGTRAVLVDRKGVVVASAASEHAAIRSEHIGWAEQEPEDWWRAAREAIASVMAAAGGAEIEAIGLTGQMHGCVMLDAGGEVLRPALIWCDQRTQPECGWLEAKIGRERLIELTCNPALPNFTLTKLLWVRAHQPEIFGRIAHVLCPKDYVRFRLTGEYAMDMQEASGTLLLDVAGRRWSEEVAEAAGIPLSWLPRLFEGPEICARVSAAGASATGLVAGTPVAAGAGDQGAGAVGMGVVGRGAGWGAVGARRGCCGKGDCWAGFGVGDDWDERGGVCRDRQADHGPAGAAAHVLPCGAGALACDGSDQRSGAFAALVSRYVCGGSFV